MVFLSSGVTEELYSGLAMNTTGFGCGWDSGQMGFIYATKETIEMTGVAPENVEAGLIEEVKTYSQFLSGDVWGYVIKDSDGSVLDSCCSFYGHDDCETEAKSALAFCEKEAAEKAKKDKEEAYRLKQRILDAASNHGSDSDPDNETGDVQDAFSIVWLRLTPEQQRSAYAAIALANDVEQWLGEEEG